MRRFSDYTSDSSEAPPDPYLVSEFEYGMRTECYCGAPLEKKVAYTDPVNPGRLYFTCKSREDGGTHTHHTVKWWDDCAQEELRIVNEKIEEIKYLKEENTKLKDEMVRLNCRQVYLDETMEKLMVRNKKNVETMFLCAAIVIFIVMLITKFQ